MAHQPERTCVGCRGVFPKDGVIRIVSGPGGIVLDYREKLPGRAAYVCPRPDCIVKALGRGAVSRALRLKTGAPLPGADEFVALLRTAIEEKIKSLVAMSAKAGKLAAGYSAAYDAVEKGLVETLLYARDISEGTKKKVSFPAARPVREITLFTRDELGRLLGRELVGVVGITDKGLAGAVWREAERLKGLINSSK
ncbi:MAG TPA: DUF448 domain-containing protein [Nitrospirota bacterium]